MGTQSKLFNLAAQFWLTTYFVQLWEIFFTVARKERKSLMIRQNLEFAKRKASLLFCSSVPLRKGTETKWTWPRITLISVTKNKQQRNNQQTGKEVSVTALNKQGPALETILLYVQWNMGGTKKSIQHIVNLTWVLWVCRHQYSEFDFSRAQMEWKMTDKLLILQEIWL